LNIWTNIYFTIIWILKQAINYLFAVFNSIIILDKLNKILTNCLVRVAIFTNFKTVHSHITAVVFIIHLKLLLFIREYWHFITSSSEKNIQNIRLKTKRNSNTKITIRLSPSNYELLVEYEESP